MKKVIFAVMVMVAVTMASCTSGAPEASTTNCDSTCVDSCKVAPVDSAAVVVDTTAVADTTKK